MSNIDTKALQQLVARVLTDAHFRKELLERPQEVLESFDLTSEQHEAVIAALKDKQAIAEIVTRLSAEFGAKAASV